MKRFLLILSLVIGSMLTSCEQPTILSVSQTALSFDNKGGNQSVTLTANKLWTASSNQGWLRISPSSGEGNASISVSCEANSSYDSRTGAITIISEEVTQTISITQAEGVGLIVSQTEFNLTNDAQTISVEVQANVQYTVDIDAACRDWIKQNSTKGLSSNTVKFDISKNEAYDGREGKIIIKQSNGSLSATVVVKQSQTNGLFVSTPEYSLSNEKHTLTVEIKSNIEFEVKSEVDWIRYIGTKGLKTSQITLEVAANDEYDSREGKVVVNQKDGSLTGTITIKQDEKQGIIVSQSQFNLTDEAQTIDIEVKYNVDFDIVIPEDCKNWIKRVSTKGLSSKNYSFYIANNQNFDPREGSITFKQKNGPLSETISVKQDQKAYLATIQDKYEVSCRSSTIDVTVRSNMNYDVIIDESCQSWVSRIETKSIVDSIVSFTIAENYKEETRSGAIKFKNERAEAIVNIQQRPKEFVDFTDDNFRAFCLEKFDENKDGEVSFAEAEQVTSISVTTEKISSLGGIERFVNLKRLICGTGESIRYNGIEYGTGLLKELDLSGNKKLEILYCWNNRLESLNIRNNLDLRELSCEHNKLKSLDCSNNVKLKKLVAAIYDSDYQSLKEILLRKGTTPEIYYDKVSEIKFVGEPYFGSVAEPIDLGLSVKWASWNLGSTEPCEYGGLYGMADPTGELRTEEEKDYYYAPGIHICGTQYDIATMQWGKKWRLPTHGELLELQEKCIWKYEYSMNGVKGSLVIGPNGNSIFIPYSGFRKGMRVYRLSDALLLSGDAYDSEQGYHYINSRGYPFESVDLVPIGVIGMTVRPVYN